MTREEVVALCDRWRLMYSERDSAGLASLYSTTGVIVSPMFATVEGRPAIEGSYRSLFTAFPDWTMDVEPPIVDGDRVAQVVHIIATHGSELFGLPGTGKRVQFRGVNLFTLEGGFITHERRIYDFTGLLIQLGVLRSKPA